jgi:Ribonuclease G/E
MPDSMILDVMRNIQMATNRENVQEVVVTVATNVAYQILNAKRAALTALERDTDTKIVIRGDAGFTIDQVEYTCLDGRGRPMDPPSFQVNAAGGAATKTMAS